MKEILGFKREIKNDDSVCPNCGWELNLPIRVEKDSGFLNYKIEYWDEYTCEKCKMQWRIKQ